jgi:ketosteroid isomerase-like protein
MSDADVRRIIETKNKAVVGWYASGEVEKLGEIFARDVWQMPPNMPAIVGLEALVGFWSGAVSAGDWTFHLETQDVVVSHPLAVERGTYRLSFEAGPEAPPEMPSFEDRGNYVVAWRHDEDGEWRILWDAPVSAKPLLS